LQWHDIDMKKGHAWIHPDEAKMKKAIPVPLTDDAIAVLKSRLGQHPQYVFTYKGKPIGQCNTKAWKKALERAGIKNFRWHDLRHTWASWHVQSGTSLQELQQLGGWSSFEMVLRYAHLSSDHLRNAANRIGSMMQLKVENEG
jgi:integrase